MNIPAQIIADYISPEDEKMSGQEIWKAIEAVQMLVSIRNTDRLVAAMEKLDDTMMLQMRSSKTK